MYQLDSDYLFVNILDPIEDSCKLGTRYCTGGSIFSVFDKKGNSLLSGPTYPSAYIILLMGKESLIVLIIFLFVPHHLIIN